jgi:hypothetical protein
LSGEYLNSINLRELIEHGANRDSSTVYANQLFKTLLLAKNRKYSGISVSCQESLLVVPGSKNPPGGVLVWPLAKEGIICV